MNVLTGYVSSSVTDCTNNYKLYFSNGTIYTARSPVSIAEISGILIITSNIEFKYSFYIVVSTVQLTAPFTTKTISFTVTQSCGLLSTVISASNSISVNILLISGN